MPNTFLFHFFTQSRDGRCHPCYSLPNEWLEKLWKGTDNARPQIQRWGNNVFFVIHYLWMLKKHANPLQIMMVIPNPFTKLGYTLLTAAMQCNAIVKCIKVSIIHSLDRLRLPLTVYHICLWIIIHGSSPVAIGM